MIKGIKPQLSGECVSTHEEEEEDKEGCRRDQFAGKIPIESDALPVTHIKARKDTHLDTHKHTQNDSLIHISKGQ